MSYAECHSVFFIFKETLDIMKCAGLSNLQMTFLNVAVKSQWQFA